MLSPVMEYSRPALTFTERFEQCRLVAYQDTGGIWTIGYGHTHGVKMGDTCTQAEAEAWLRADVFIAVTDVNRMLRVRVTQNEFDALVDFAFNCGTKALNYSRLLLLVNTRNMQLAAKEFERWDHVGGHVVAGLLKRRIAEENLFERV